LHRLDHRLRLHDHPRSAPERHVVHLAVAVMRMLAEVVCLELDNSALDGATDHALLEDRAEHGREDGDDVESNHQSLASSDLSSQSCTTTRPAARSTSTTASLVAGIRCSMVPSRLTHTSLAGRSRTSAMTPSSAPELDVTARPIP